MKPWLRSVYTERDLAAFAKEWFK